MKILTICPSIYPDKLEKMLISYYTTVNTPNIIINTEKGSITNILNKTFEKNPDFDFYHISNDDVIYHTKDWDVKLAHKGKVSYGDDLFQRENLCTFPMIDGNIVRSLGWIQQPTLERYYGDTTWNHMGRQCGIMNYVPEVIIQHNWEGADMAIYNLDTQRFGEWLPWAFKDISRIKEKLNERS